MGFLLVMKAEFMRAWIITRRYWFAALISMVVAYVMLIGFIYGFTTNRDATIEKLGQTFQSSDTTVPFAEAATEKCVALLIGLYAFAQVGLFTGALAGMARTGHLEQLCMSPHGLVTNLIARSCMAAVSRMVSSAWLLVLFALTVGGTLHFKFVPIMIVFALLYANLLGFGFMLGGLVLVFKSIGQVTNLVRIGILLVAMIAKEGLDQYSWPVRLFFHALPVTDGTICLKQSLLTDIGWGIFAHPSFLLLVISCVVWTALGITCFKAMETYSRKKGTLGAY